MNRAIGSVLERRKKTGASGLPRKMGEMRLRSEIVIYFANSGCWRERLCDHMADREPRFDQNSKRVIGLVYMIPALLMAGPVVGYGLGWLIQRYAHTGDWIYGVTVLFGLGVGIREVVRVVQRISKMSE